jgi:hypothetical protein
VTVKIESCRDGIFFHRSGRLPEENGKKIFRQKAAKFFSDDFFDASRWAILA